MAGAPACTRGAERERGDAQRERARERERERERGDTRREVDRESGAPLWGAEG